MKATLYVGLALILVPFQVALLNSISPFDVLPDLCLIAVCLVGFWAGHIEGLIVGLIFGFLQDLFSAGEMWVNMVTKGLVGLCSGLVAKNLTNATPQAIGVSVLAFSLFSSFGFMVSSRGGMEIGEILQGVHSTLLPQALLDGMIAIGTGWLLSRWVPPASAL